MSRLPSLTARQVAAALRRAGFEEKRQRGSHLILWNPGTKRIVTVPMHRGDLAIGTLRAIISQAGLSDEAFLELL
jgi:predicted RNA binding protein YcfA (HicA-like mRNA interferase family)